MTIFVIVGLVAAILIMAVRKGDEEPGAAIPPDFSTAMKAAYRTAQTRGIYFPLVYAVARVETADGQGQAFKRTNNAFSIHTGAGLGTATPFWDGVSHYETSRGENLRVYRTLSDSISDFCLLISTRPIWSEAYAAAEAGDAEGFFQALQHEGYAGTSTTYAAALSARYRGMV